MIFKSYTGQVTLLVTLVIVLAACQSTAITPEVVQLQPVVENPTEEATIIPSVNVMAQEITNGTVTVAQVDSNGPGWIVIHAQADGNPGPILGYSPVVDGPNQDVAVEIDTAKATETLYAMLHTDAGVMGTFEFPDGPDNPVKVNDQVVTPPFTVSGLMMPTEEVQPSVSVEDQEMTNGTVTVTQVVSNGPGWIVIHAQANGNPGPILGYSPVVDGPNQDVAVEIDAAKATETLYAMLHTDAGVMGTFEFPDGPDNPVKVNDQVVTPPFQVSTTQTTKTAEVIISDFSFSPGELTISVGTSVVWRHTGSYSHTVTADDNTFSSGNLGNGDTFEFTFTEPGTYPYHCQFHGGAGGQGMSGVITVNS
jgi:plastocyanin